MKLDKAEAQLQGRLELGERVPVSTDGVPLVNTASLSVADLVGSGGEPPRRVGLGIGGAIVGRHDKMIRRDAVTGGESSITRSVPTEAKAFGLVLTDRRLALYHRNVELDLPGRGLGDSARAGGRRAQARAHHPDAVPARAFR